MNYRLLRNRFLPTRTVGQLYLSDQEFFCFTEEDVVREVKIPRETAIPQGLYQLALEKSQRFGPDTPTVLNVPGFSGIRIHAGNTEADTEGCILLGYSLTEVGTIYNSRLAVEHFKRILKQDLATDKVWLEITSFGV